MVTTNWWDGLWRGIVDVGTTAAPYVGQFFTQQQQLELSQLELEQMRIEAQLQAQAQQVAADRQKTTMVVLGVVGAAAIVAFLAFRK